jgi:transketolase
MASIAEIATDNPALAAQAAILARPGTQERRLADAVRALAIDAVEVATSAIPACRWAWPMSPPACGGAF